MKPQINGTISSIIIYKIFTHPLESTQFHIWCVINNKQNKSTNFPKLSSSSSFLIQIKHFNIVYICNQIFSIKTMPVYNNKMLLLLAIVVRIQPKSIVFYINTQTKIFFVKENILNIQINSTNNQICTAFSFFKPPLDTCDTYAHV